MTTAIERALYRGRDTDSGHWNYGELQTLYGPVSIANIHGVFEVDPSTVCQWTGLADKNGDKIFEGDTIVRYGEFEPCKHVVTWQMCSYTIGDDDMSELLMDQDTASMYTIHDSEADK